MTREEAAIKLTVHYMSCGMLMPLGWLDKNGEGSELFEAFKMAQDALRGKDMNVHTNADRIRAMSDEELANVISCPQEFFGLMGCPDVRDCTTCKQKWLKQPAEV